MKCIYEMAVVARCPKGGRDEYSLVISADKMIEVEKIITVVDGLTARPIYQEDLTKGVADSLDRITEASGVVVTTGVHSGVKAKAEETFGDG